MVKNGTFLSPDNIDSIDESVMLKEISTKIKPPHRYSKNLDIKETTMAYYRGSVLLYGGLGCGVGLSWAKLDLSTKVWTFPSSEEKPQRKETKKLSIMDSHPERIRVFFIDFQLSSIYGHSMSVHQEWAYAFGGMSSRTLSDLTLVNVKHKMMLIGPKAPFHRR